MRLRGGACSSVMRAGRTAQTSPMAGPYSRATVPPARPRKISARRGQRGPLLAAGGHVDVEHDIPRGARLHPVQVTDRQHRAQAGQVDAIGVTAVYGPGEGTEALPGTGRPAGATAHAAARADRLAVA